MNSTLDWKAYRFGYEFDFITKSRGFAGFIIEGEYTDVQRRAHDTVAEHSTSSRARACRCRRSAASAASTSCRNISITGEVTGFKLPDSIDDRYGGHYVDLDIYGTANFTNNVGAQVRLSIARPRVSGQGTTPARSR